LNETSIPTQSELNCNSGHFPPAYAFTEDAGWASDLIELALTHSGQIEQETAMRNASCSLYYGFVRALKPRHVMILGAGLRHLAECFAIGIEKNGEGRLSLVASSRSGIKNLLMESFRKRSECDCVVEKKFREYLSDGIATRYDLTSEQFFADYERHCLPKIDIAVIDVDRNFRDVRLDFTCVLAHSRRNTLIFLHEGKLARRKFPHQSRSSQWSERIKKLAGTAEFITVPHPSNEYLIRVTQD
jgi:hypothetical protein